MLFLQYYLWIAPHLLLALCLIGIFRRHRQSELPLFTGCMVFSLVQFAALFVLSQKKPLPRGAYHWTLAITEGIEIIWGLAIVYELAHKLLFLRASVTRFSRPILRLSLAALVILSAVGAASSSDLPAQHILDIWARLNFCSNLIMAGMLVALLVLTTSLHISWRNWITGIALGYGVYASIALVGAALRSGIGRQVLVLADIVEMAAFHVCVVIWLVYIFLPDRPRGLTGGVLQKPDLESWDQQLQQMIRP